MESTSLLDNFKGISIMSLVERNSTSLDDKKEAVATMPFSEKKSSTKDVDKGTD